MSRRRPPLLARLLLGLLLPRSVRDDFAGDLEERFQRTAADRPRAARRAYWRDVLSPTVLRLRREVDEAKVAETEVGEESEPSLPEVVPDGSHGFEMVGIERADPT